MCVAKAKNPWLSPPGWVMVCVLGRTGNHLYAAEARSPNFKNVGCIVTFLLCGCDDITCPLYREMQDVFGGQSSCLRTHVFCSSHGFCCGASVPWCFC